MGWVGLGWVEIFQFLVGWFGLGLPCTKSTKKVRKDYVNAFKARLDTIWLHQAVKFVSCIGLGWVTQLMGCVGSGHTKWTHGQLLVGVTETGHQILHARRLRAAVTASRAPTTLFRRVGFVGSPMRQPRHLH